MRASWPMLRNGSHPKNRPPRRSPEETARNGLPPEHPTPIPRSFSPASKRILSPRAITEAATRLTWTRSWPGSNPNNALGSAASAFAFKEVTWPWVILLLPGIALCVVGVFLIAHEREERHRALRKRAVAAGGDESSLEAADDAEDSRAALVALVLEQALNYQRLRYRLLRGDPCGASNNLHLYS